VARFKCLEIVGFRSIKSRDSAAGSDAPGTHHRTADRVSDLIARRESTLADAHLDAQRWLDDGGNFSHEEVAWAAGQHNDESVVPRITRLEIQP
jgi:hypothetical protein